jgi:hypothetical protein
MKPEREQELRNMAKKDTPQGRLAKELLVELDLRDAHAAMANGTLSDALADVSEKAVINSGTARELAVLKEALRRAVDDVGLLTKDNDTESIRAEYLSQAESSVPADIREIA